MTKVVYNACHGGFALSREAVLLAREITGDPKWGGPCIAGDVYNEGKEVKKDYGFIDVERIDPTLVSVVESLGEKASGDMARLRVEDIPSGQRYRIDEYDGYESVMTVDDYDWKTA